MVTNRVRQEIIWIAPIEKFPKVAQTTGTVDVFDMRSCIWGPTSRRASTCPNLHVRCPVAQLSHNDAPQSLGLLWTSDQFVAETCTLQHTTLTADKHRFPPVGFEPTISAGERPLGPALRVTKATKLRRNE
jgi:hypothetical protein